METESVSFQLVAAKEFRGHRWCTRWQRRAGDASFRSSAALLELQLRKGCQSIEVQQKSHDFSALTGSKRACLQGKSDHLSTFTALNQPTVEDRNAQGKFFFILFA